MDDEGEQLALAAPTVNLTLNKRVASPMAPAVVSCHIGLHTEENLLDGRTWTQNAATDEYWCDVSDLGDTLYNIRIAEKWTNRDLNTGFQWTASAGGTNEYYLEASGGGDPGVWDVTSEKRPIVRDPHNSRAGFAISDTGTPLNSSVKAPGDLAAGNASYGSNPSDTLSFITFYARLAAGGDPDATTMTATYWERYAGAGSGAGALNASEWHYDQAEGKLYIRTRGSVDPSTLSSGDILIDYDLSTTGTSDSNDWHDTRVQCWVEKRAGAALDTAWPTRWRQVTDYRRTAEVQTLAKTATESAGPMEGFGLQVILGPGTFRFGFRVTNKDLDTTTAYSDEFTIAANTRTQYNVAAMGGDYTDLEAAVADLAGSDDIEIILETGGSETVAAVIQIADDNWYVHVADHSLDYTLTDGGDGECLMVTGSGTIVELTCNPAGAYTSGPAVNFQGSYLGFRINFGGAFDGNRFWSAYFFDNDPQFVCIINSTIGATHGYTIVGQSSDWACRDLTMVGNDSGASTNESIYRLVGGLIRGTFGYYRADSSDVPSKSAFRLLACYGVYLHGLRHLDGDLVMGTISSDAAECCRISCGVSTLPNILTSHQFTEGSFRVRVVNCVLTQDATRILTTDASPDQPVHYGGVIGCTLVSGFTTSTSSISFAHSGGTLSAGVHIRGFKFKGNRIVVAAGASFDATNGFLRTRSLTAASIEYDQNVWPDPADWSATRISTLGSTLANHNAHAQVGTDYAVTTTLDSDYLPTVGQDITSPGECGGVDMWGNTRAATDEAGAVVAADPGPPEEDAGADPPVVSSIDPETGEQGATNLDITVTGTDFVDGADATFSGTGITVNSTTFVSATELTVNVDIASDATASARDITVTNPDAQEDTLGGAFTVTAVSSGGATPRRSRRNNLIFVREELEYLYGTDGARIRRR